MKIDRKYRPQLIVSKDPAREVLKYVNIVQEHAGITGPCAVATDGRRAVVVPVEVEDGDVLGMVRGDAFNVAAKNSCRWENKIQHGRSRRVRPSTVSVKLDAERITTENTASYPRYDKDGVTKQQPRAYPNSSMVIPKKEDMKIKVSLNPTFLLELCYAMGGKGTSVTIEAQDEFSPMLVTIAGEKAISVLMPMRA